MNVTNTERYSGAMGRLLVISTLLYLSLLAGCKVTAPSFATLECKDIESYESSAGWLNLNFSKIGQIVGLKEMNNDMWNGTFIGAIPYSNDDLAANPQKIKERKLNLNLDYTVTLSGGTDDISPQKAEKLKLALSKIASRQAHLILKNSEDNRLKLPLNFIKNVDSSYMEIMQAYSSQGYFFYLVSTLTTAESLTINLGNTDSLALNADLKSFAKLDLSISHKCDANVDIEGGAVFYKPTFFKLEDGKITPANAVPLNKVNMTVAVN